MAMKSGPHQPGEVGLDRRKSNSVKARAQGHAQFFLDFFLKCEKGVAGKFAKKRCTCVAVPTSSGWRAVRLELLDLAPNHYGKLYPLSYPTHLKERP